MAKKKSKAKRTTDTNSSLAFAMQQINPKIERILSLDVPTEDARQEHSEFVYRTLCEMWTAVVKDFGLFAGGTRPRFRRARG
jgi:hypothetical protein